MFQCLRPRRRREQGHLHPHQNRACRLGPARGGGSPQIAQGGGVSVEMEVVERVLGQAESELLSV